MKHIILFGLFIATTFFVSAQKAENSINAKEVERIERVLASDEMKGRRIFSPEIDKAADFIAVTVDVTNSGKLAGDEVVQLYIRDVLSSVTMYEKLLKGFERVHLQPGETKTVSFTIPRDELKLYNREMKFVLEPGEFRVMVGASSSDIKQTGSFYIK